MKKIVMVLALCLPGIAFAQALDTPYQVRYWVNTNQVSTVRLVNTGANGASLTDGPEGTICANVYAFATNGQMTSCCACPVPPDGLVSLPVNTNLVPAGNPVPSALVVKIVSTRANAGMCAGPTTVGTAASPIAAGFLSWISGPQETPFIPSTLSAGELAKLTTQCTSLNMPTFCKSCPQY